MNKLSDLAGILSLPLMLILQGGWVVIVAFGVLWGIGHFFEILLLRQIAGILLFVVFGLAIFLLFAIAVLEITNYVLNKYSKEYKDSIAAGVGRKSAFFKSSAKGVLVFAGLLILAILWIYSYLLTPSE